MEQQFITPKVHGQHLEESQMVCSCGWKSKPARIKVLVKRSIRHSEKTGHEVVSIKTGKEN